MRQHPARQPFQPDGNEPHLIGEGYLVEIKDKAIKVQLQSGQNIWIPMRVVHDDSELYGKDVIGKAQELGTDGKLIVKRWWARQEGYVR